MTDAGTLRFGRFGWVLVVAGLLLGNPGAALAASLPDLKVTALTNPPSTALPGESFAVTSRQTSWQPPKPCRKINSGFLAPDA